MTKVYFVRHCEPNYNNHDDELRELSEKGLKDRKLATKFLEGKEIDYVLSSPYKRAIDTVKDFADKFNLEIKTVFDLRERKVDNCWIEDFDGFCKNQWNDFNYKLIDGETLKEVQNRNINALNKILKEYENKNIVIGSHGTALSMIINYYDKSFNYENFKKIKSLMPWIVSFTFHEDKCLSIEQYNIFNKEFKF